MQTSILLNKKVLHSQELNYTSERHSGCCLRDHARPWMDLKCLYMWVRVMSLLQYTHMILFSRVIFFPMQWWLTSDQRPQTWQSWYVLQRSAWRWSLHLPQVVHSMHWDRWVFRSWFVRKPLLQRGQRCCKLKDRLLKDHLNTKQNTIESC